MDPQAPEPRDPIFLGTLQARTSSAGGWEGACRERVKGRGREEGSGPSDRMDGWMEVGAVLAQGPWRMMKETCSDCCSLPETSLPVVWRGSGEQGFRL